MKRFLSCVCLGAIIGAAGMFAFLSQRMDDLYVMNKQMLLEQGETKSQLRVLENRLAQYHKLIVIGIDYQYDKVPDNLERLQLQSQLKSVVENLLGQPVRELKPDTVIALLHNRVVPIGDKNYRIRVRAVTLAERICYYLDVTSQGIIEDDEP